MSHWQIERGITNTKSQNIPPKLSVRLLGAENGADTSLPHVAFLKKDSHITELAKKVNKTEYFQSHLSNFHKTHTFLDQSQQKEDFESGILWRCLFSSS